MADADAPDEESDDYLPWYGAKYYKPYLLKNLLRFGFTPQVAAMICEDIPDQIVSLQTPAYWATRYIDSFPEEDSP